MGKARVLLGAILRRSEQGTEKQHKAIGVLVRCIARLPDQIGRFTADLGHVRAAGQVKAISPRDRQG